MARRRRQLLGALLAALAICATLPSATVATNYTVGDEKGWNPNVDYTAWVKKHRPFYKGDWLLFEYLNGRSDVVEVDEVGYEKCDAANPIFNYSKGHSYAFQLREARNYYFICSYGYCYSGMKLSLTAQKPPSPPPGSKSAASSPSSAAAGRTVAAGAAAVAALLQWMF